MPPPSIIPIPHFVSPSDVSVPEKLYIHVNIPLKLSRAQSASSKPTVHPQTTPSSSLGIFTTRDEGGIAPQQDKQAPLVPVLSEKTRRSL